MVSREHKGYGTREHMEKLRHNKACAIHRKSFKPVAAAMPTLSWLRKEGRIGQWGEQVAAVYLIRKGLRDTNHEPRLCPLWRDRYYCQK